VRRLVGAGTLIGPGVRFLTSAIALYERAGFGPSDGEPRELCGTPLLNMRKALVLQPSPVIGLILSVRPGRSDLEGLHGNALVCHSGGDA